MLEWTDAIGVTVSPEQRGSVLRGVLQDAEDAARRNGGAPWRAVDPDGRLAIAMRPVQDVAERVRLPYWPGWPPPPLCF